MKDLEKMLGKKKKREENPMEKEAKLGVLKDLRGMASGMMRDGMKATVMAKDKKGLEDGLDKAKDLVKHSPMAGKDPDPRPDNAAIEEKEEEVHRDLDNDDELGEDPIHQMKVMAEDCSDEDLDEVIRMLEEKKRAKQMKA